MSRLSPLALTPPMGWNSWDCYGTTVREDEVKANADFMAAHLTRYGWNHIVVDIQWYEPEAKAHGYRKNAALVLDEYGRTSPALNRFPSAANGVGFKALADYVHSKGLKFGIHIMRGIPRQAVRQNLPILDTPYHAQDIADPDSVCAWNDDMYGVDMSKPGADAYYESLVKLYAAWGVDYIKCDDMAAPSYHGSEIGALSRAIRGSGRDIVLSLSPGTGLSTDHADHLKRHCELWRITDDFWDRWEDLKKQFEVCAAWATLAEPGCWPDPDMLPLGHLGIRAERGVDRPSLFTHDEQIMLMTLWAIFRAPLMFGGDLPTSDDFALSLITNEDVLAVNQHSSHNRELYRQGDHIVWTADAATSEDRYLALFNVGDTPAEVHVDFLLLGEQAAYEVRDLWASRSLGMFQEALHAAVAPHAAKLYRLTAPR